VPSANVCSIGSASTGKRSSFVTWKRRRKSATPSSVAAQWCSGGWFDSVSITSRPLSSPTTCTAMPRAVGSVGSSSPASLVGAKNKRAPARTTASPVIGASIGFGAIAGSVIVFASAAAVGFASLDAASGAVSEHARSEAMIASTTDPRGGCIESESTREHVVIITFDRPAPCRLAAPATALADRIPHDE
jgi:hypothetical protein